jgi:glycosyltransferase involved in cell wall biosynthesis
MAYALPVVGCDVGGIPEMVVNGETGLLVPARAPAALGQAIEQLIVTSELRQRLGEKARLRCEEQFSLSVHIAAAEGIYQRVIAHPSKPALGQVPVPQ